jgi:hypothetical protein
MVEEIIDVHSISSGNRMWMVHVEPALGDTTLMPRFSAVACFALCSLSDEWGRVRKAVVGLDHAEIHLGVGLQIDLTHRRYVHEEKRMEFLEMWSDLSQNT